MINKTRDDEFETLFEKLTNQVNSKENENKKDDIEMKKDISSEIKKYQNLTHEQICGIEIEELFKIGFTPMPNFIDNLGLTNNEFKLLSVILKRYNLTYNLVQNNLNQNSNVDENQDIFIWLSNQEIIKNILPTVNGVNIRNILDVFDHMNLIRIEMRKATKGEFKGTQTRIVYVDWWSKWLEYYNNNFATKGEREKINDDRIKRIKARIKMDSIS